MTYTVTVTDWTQSRGYRNSGRGWRVRCFATDDNNWNALSQTISETFHRTEIAARKQAAELAKRFNAKIM